MAGVWCFTLQKGCVRRRTDSLSKWCYMISCERLADAVSVLRTPREVTLAITVLLADDVELVRRAIRSLLRDEPQIEIVGEASELSQTLKMAQELHPQVIVLDVHMHNPISVPAADVKTKLAGARLLAISVWTDEETKATAEGLGAITLLDKMNLASELIPTILQQPSTNASAAYAGQIR